MDLSTAECRIVLSKYAEHLDPLVEALSRLHVYDSFCQGNDYYTRLRTQFLTEFADSEKEYFESIDDVLVRLRFNFIRTPSKLCQKFKKIIFDEGILSKNHVELLFRPFEMIKVLTLLFLL